MYSLVIRPSVQKDLKTYTYTEQIKAAKKAQMEISQKDEATYAVVDSVKRCTHQNVRNGTKEIGIHKRLRQSRN